MSLTSPSFTDPSQPQDVSHSGQAVPQPGQAVPHSGQSAPQPGQSAPQPGQAVCQPGTGPEVLGFPERRRTSGGVGGRAGLAAGRAERRQFGNSHHGLSEAGRELAQAIDRYKLNNHRRYITCDEMLTVLQELGYRRSEGGACPE